MHPLRNLSIGGKLALSAASGLCLLGALVWMAVLDLDRQAQFATAQRVAFEHETDVNDALLAIAQMRVAGRELQYQQTDQAIGAVADRLGEQVARAHDVLQNLLSGGATADQKDKLQAALAGLAGFGTELGKAAELRRGILAARDGDLVRLPPVLTGALAKANDALAVEDLAPSELDAVRTALNSYRVAIEQLGGLTMRFLATGDGGLRKPMDAARAEAARQIKTVQAARLSETMRAQVADLAKTGDAIAAASAASVQAADAMAEHSATRMESASRAATDGAEAASAEYVGAAEMARAQAEAAQASARWNILAIGAAIALVFGLSGWATARAVARPIRAMTLAMQRMAKGDAASRIGFDNRRDEIGRMAAALEKLRGTVARVFVQSQMIDQMPSAVMTTEPKAGFRITYLNDETRRLLALVQDHLPVPVAELAGQGAEVLRLAPEQREALSDPAKLPFTARLHLGGEVMQLKVTALHDREGGYVAPMLSLTRLTEQLHLAGQFEAQVGGIARTVGASAEAMQRTAGAMETNAIASTERSTIMAAAVAQASGNVQAVAVSAEELAASVSEIARQVAESARIAAQAVAEAEATDRCIAGLSDAASRIGDVVRLIGDIAARTNLLALNATIEAARAGEAGRGFAVVAGEVKTLANQTARATEDIAAQIAAMQGETEQAVSALRSIGGTIKHLDEIATAIAGAVEEQGAATHEIARAVQQASVGTTEVNGNIEGVNGAMAQTRAQAGQVLEAAGHLAGQSETLTQEVERFLGALRAAA